MKTRPIEILTLLFLLVTLNSCTANEVTPDVDNGSVYSDQFLIGDTYILENGTRIEGDIVGIGTNLIIHEKASVSGNISLVGSVLNLSGEVKGDINVFAGASTIRDTAVIYGDINQIFHQALISPNAHILGESNTYAFPYLFGDSLWKGITTFVSWYRPANWFLFFLARMIGFVLIALMVIILFPKPTGRVVAGIEDNIAPAWGVGIISLLILPFISVILIITICLSPLGLLLLLLLLISYIWGLIGLSFLFGRRLWGWLGLEQSKEIITVTGAICLTFLSMLLRFIPLVGFLIHLMISAIGLGGVIFSCFGTYTR